MPARRLPDIMVAPNGARRGKQDHPALPITIEETVDTVVACHQAGAGGAHLHIRDAEGKHILDAGMYRELLAELSRAVPDLVAQITTESVGMYSSRQQQALVRELCPEHASIALREICAGESETSVKAFFDWAGQEGVVVQHILYAPEDVDWLADLVRRGIVSGQGLEVLFVLGRYSVGQQSQPSDLDPFLESAKRSGLEMGWALCAFGQQETDCLLRALDLGGKARIGFENSLFNRDGTLARDNAERVSELVAAMGSDKL